MFFSAKTYHLSMSFSFVGTGFRTPERVVLFVWVPASSFTQSKEITKSNMAAYEDWLLRVLSEPVNELSETLQNNHKDSREKARFYMQTTSPVVQRRNGCIYAEEKEAFRLRIDFCFPLINGWVVNGKSSHKCMKLLLDMICDCLHNAEKTNLLEHIRLYERQKEIQYFLAENELLAFVADGSILPRQGDTELPMREAVPFQSPPELRTTVHFCDGTELTEHGRRKKYFLLNRKKQCRVREMRKVIPTDG